MGSGCIDTHYLDLGTSWRSAVSFTPRPLYPREKAPGTHCIGGWVSPRAGLGDTKMITFLTLPRLELRPLGRPARSLSLYRLRYPRSSISSVLRYLIFIITVIKELHFEKLTYESSRPLWAYPSSLRPILIIYWSLKRAIPYKFPINTLYSPLPCVLYAPAHLSPWSN
jgi:hypothetical protein